MFRVGLSHQKSSRTGLRAGRPHAAGRDAGATPGSESGVMNDRQDAGPTKEIASSLHSSQ
jgi:hypothetical protein